MDTRELLIALSGYGLAVPVAVYAVVQRKRLRAKQVDDLTGLAVRSAFYERAPALLRRGGTTLVFLDLDRFKDVNDRHGYEFGDALLALTGERIRATAGPGAIAGRFGGDEFALILDTSTIDAARQLLEQLIVAITAPIDLRSLANSFDLAITGPSEKFLGVGASVGALYLADIDEPALSGCLQIAAELMTTVKRSGGGYRLIQANPADPRITLGVHGRPLVRARDLAAKTAQRARANQRANRSKE